MTPARRMRRILSPLEAFLRAETAGGVVLLAATAAALLWANSPWRHGYEDWWQRALTLGAGSATVELTLRDWLNDGLMVVFFFVVALEIKRELVGGELADRRKAALPVLAAVGGMALPALVFTAVNLGGDGRHGWAVPAATDIAFAVGVLALVGRGLPAGVRLFLLTLAIADDLGAIVVIAAFYSDGISWPWLIGAMGIGGAVAGMKRFGIPWPAAYLIPAVAMWGAVYRSGVHATMAGVALGLLTPMRAGGRPVLERLERGLHPVSTFVVLPAFALANAAIPLGRASVGDAFGSRITWGVVAGLAVGKTVGVAGTALLVHRLGWGRHPAALRGRVLWGTAALAGIGFTVSLFIAGLAFEGGPALADAKIGILAGSLLSALTGAVLLAPARRGVRAGPAAGPEPGRV